MTSASDSFRNVTRYTGQDYRFAPTYIRPRDPHSPTNASNDIKPKEQQGYYPVTSLWTNSTNGNIWALAKITNNLANWVLISGGGSGPALDFIVPNGTSPVFPDVSGNVTLTSTDSSITITGSTNAIDFKTANGAAITKVNVQTGTTPITPTAGAITVNGALVSAGTNPVRTHGTATSTYAVEVQTSQAIASTDATKVGLANFNSAQFTVDANGFVSLTGSGAAIESIVVDAHTAPGTSPVVPNGSGQIIVTGGQVAAGVVGTNVIRSDSLAANTYTIEIQRSQAVSTSTVADNGVSHFNSSQFIVDSNAFVSLGTQQGVSNLGITNTAGTTFTVNAYDGSALSSTNPAFVTLQKNATPGQLVTYRITANQSCTQTDIGASTFGLTNGVAHVDSFPLFVYAVSNAKAGVNPETIITFMLSRYPNSSISPVAGKIGKAGSIVCNSQGSFFALNSSITVADYASSPCLCIGSLRATRSAGNALTFTTLDVQDGIGLYQQDRIFSLSSTPGQYGSASGTFWYNNGGTAPVFSETGFGYTIDKSNNVQFYTAFTNCTSSGVGAVELQLAIPYVIANNALGCTNLQNASGTFFVCSTTLTSGGSSNKIKLIGVNDASNLIFLNNNVTVGASYQIGYGGRSFIDFT